MRFIISGIFMAAVPVDIADLASLIGRTIRLGDRTAAERIAWEAVRMSEKLGEATLLAE